MAPKDMEEAQRLIPVLMDVVAKTSFAEGGDGEVEIDGVVVAKASPLWHFQVVKEAGLEVMVMGQGGFDTHQWIGFCMARVSRLFSVDHAQHSAVSASKRICLVAPLL